MKIRAVIPPFLPREEIDRRVRQLIPDIDIVEEPGAPGRYTLAEIEVLIMTTFSHASAELLERMPALKFIQVASTGTDTVDLATCRKRGIMLANIPVANSKTVAEYVILATLALLRDVTTLDGDMRHGEWPLITGAHDLAGRTFGIVGMGRIGKEVAARLVPFEVATLYHDVVALPPVEERSLGLTRVNLDELLQNSDVISLNLPLFPETRGLLGERQFALMKEDVILVNAARAELVDPEALRKYVASGKVRAALDVWATEPPDFSDPLFKTPGTLYTPHVAGVTMEAQQRFLQETIKNVLRFTQGKDPLYRVDGLSPAK